ncbi:MAG: hypothetical protein ACD_40C00283G0006 [uncultured bacterium]|nr:MAG: hypothetical protein ACD_40C00283G0006 [uncultured bacterium]
MSVPRSQTFELVVVDGEEYGETITEMFMQVVGGANWLRCVNLTLGDAWRELGINGRRADGVLIHGSLRGGDSMSDNIPSNGVDLGIKLKELGYQVNMITAGGSRKFELNGYKLESGIEGFTHADIQVILELLMIASK